MLDGREVKVPGYESGNFVGPMVLADVKPNMTCYKVSCVCKVKSEYQNYLVNGFNEIKLVKVIDTRVPTGFSFLQFLIIFLL